MGIKKIARPINQAKNTFIKWLKENNAEDIDVFEGDEAPEWDYYRHASEYINRKYCSVYFMVWHGEITIDYRDSENKYENMSIDEFLQLIS